MEDKTGSTRVGLKSPGSPYSDTNCFGWYRQRSNPSGLNHSSSRKWVSLSFFLPSFHPSICPLIHIHSIYPSIHPFIHWSFLSSIHLPILSSDHLYIHPSCDLFVHIVNTLFWALCLLSGTHRCGRPHSSRNYVILEVQQQDLLPDTPHNFV